MKPSKDLGQVFTPVDIARRMLDEVQYYEEVVLTKTIMEPSFGQGVFLLEIVRRIIEQGKISQLSTQEIRTILERNVHGIEIDTALYTQTLIALNALAKEYDIHDVQWKLQNGNTIQVVLENNTTYDFVVGNPPYAKLLHLDTQTRILLKQLNFAKGSTDLYVAFFELGVLLMKEEGRLIFISPNTFFKNTSQGHFREHILKDKLIKRVIDFRARRVFNNADTYTAITYLSKEDNTFFTYVNAAHDNEKSYDIDIEEFCALQPSLSAPWMMNSQEDYDFLKNHKKTAKALSLDVVAQHGIETNSNNVYICGEPVYISDTLVKFNGHILEAGILKPIVKGSRYKGEEIKARVLFPYEYAHGKYVPLLEKILQERYPLAYAYLLLHKDALLSRDMDKGASTWYQFARSQSLAMTHRPKTIVSNIYGPLSKLPGLFDVPAGTLMYSGVYVTYEESSRKSVYEVLLHENFLRYARLIGKTMSGDYVRISAKNVNSYIR